MSNIARGKAECYISIKAKRQVLYFAYSTRQSNALTIIKNFLSHFVLTMKHRLLPPLQKNHVLIVLSFSFPSAEKNKTPCFGSFFLLQYALNYVSSSINIFTAMLYENIALFSALILPRNILYVVVTIL